MKFWIYVEPVSATSNEPIWTIMSDKAILADYWEYWCTQMDRVGRSDEISEQSCIEDWVTVHWAVEATPEALARIVSDGQ